MTTNSSDLLEDAALDAAGALDRRAREDYERRLSTASPGERAEIAQLYDAAALLAAGESTADALPTPALKEKILGRLTTSAGFTTVRAGERDWHSMGIPGVFARPLHVDADRAVLFVTAKSGVVFPAHRHTGAEDMYVISGRVTAQGRSHGPGDFHHADAGSDHEPLLCEEDCELLLIVDPRDYQAPAR